MAGPERIINIHGHLRQHQDIPARMRCWREWNVEKFVCLCLHRRFHGRYFTNEDFLAMRSTYKDIILGFAAFDGFVGEVDGPGDIERYAEQGFAGLKFHDVSYPYNHEAYFPAYEKAQDLGLPILFHTGYMAYEADSDARYGIDAENYRPYFLDKVARAFPGLKMIGSHLGGPHYHEALQMLSAHPNVYYDLSGGGGGKVHVRKIISAMGPQAGLKTDMSDPAENNALTWFDKLCFGTDNPEPDVWVPASELIMDRLEIPAQTRRKFYYDNAAALLGIDAD